MKGSKSLIAISIAFTVAIVPSAIAVPKTTVKAAGRITTNVVNTILNGVGVPAKTVGIDGDFYIDTKNLNLYGPKVKGVWKVGTSLKQVDSKSVTTVIGEAGSITSPRGRRRRRRARARHSVHTCRGAARAPRPRGAWAGACAPSGGAAGARA